MARTKAISRRPVDAESFDLSGPASESDGKTALRRLASLTQQREEDPNDKDPDDEDQNGKGQEIGESEDQA